MIKNRINISLKNWFKFLIVFLTVFSCQEQVSNKTSEKGKPEAQESIPDSKIAKKLIMDFDLELTEVEDIKLISTDIFLNNGQFMDLYIYQKLNGNETTKTVHFELPEGIVPDGNIGISFGTEKVKEVKINHIYLSLGDVSFDIPSEEIENYFRTNQFITFDTDKKVFITQKVNGRLNPILFLRKPFIDKLQGL